jgi:hypothetical protein
VGPPRKWLEKLWTDNCIATREQDQNTPCDSTGLAAPQALVHILAAVDCPLTIHVSKAWSPGWCHWEELGSFRGRSPVGGTEATGHDCRGLTVGQNVILCFLAILAPPQALHYYYPAFLPHIPN